MASRMPVRIALVAALLCPLSGAAAEGTAAETARESVVSTSPLEQMEHAWEVVSGLRMRLLGERFLEAFAKPLPGTRDDALREAASWLVRTADSARRDKPEAFFVVSRTPPRLSLPKELPRGLTGPLERWRHATEEIRRLQRERADRLAALDERYAKKLQESAQRAVLEQHHQREREQIEARYTAQLAPKRTAEREALFASIAALEKHLEEHPKHSAATPAALLWLSEAYLARAHLTHDEAMRRFFAAYEAWSQRPEGAPPDEPVLELAPVVAVCQRLVVEHPDAPQAADARYLLGWALAQDDSGEAERAYRVFLEHHREDRRAPEVLLRLGELSFDARRFPQAASDYRRCLLEQGGGPYLNHCTYKLAWARFFDGAFEEAADGFLQLANRAAAAEACAKRRERCGGAGPLLAHEATTYLALSVLGSARYDAARGGFDFVTPSERAVDRLEEPKARLQVLATMADHLAMAGEMRQAALLAERAIAADPNHPEAPRLLRRLISAWDHLGEAKAARAARERFLATYGAESRGQQQNAAQAGPLEWAAAELPRIRQELDDPPVPRASLSRRLQRDAWLLERCVAPLARVSELDLTASTKDGVVRDVQHSRAAPKGAARECITAVVKALRAPGAGTDTRRYRISFASGHVPLVTESPAP